MSAMANESLKEERAMREEHHSGAGKYLVVWIALMVLTVITVVTGRMHLPDWGLLLALVIATVKGTMVVLYFMHLADHHGANRVVFVTSVFFVALLIGFTLFDFGTRFRPSLPFGAVAPDFPISGQDSGRYGGELKPPGTQLK